jgi:molecular chaperone DnaK
MSRVIGIDLGTTYSCLAHLQDDTPKVIPNLEGTATTPSIISFTSGGEVLVGNLALRQALTNPEKTIYAVKRLVGRKFQSPEITEARKRLPYKLAEAANGDVLIEAGPHVITPQEASALILKYLKKCAESFFSEDVTECVITVPAHFNDHQRQATKDAASIAGLHVTRIINEPTAASLAYGLNQRKNGLVAVYDLGGGTFDITLLEISGGVFHVLATDGDTYLGGEDFDQRIIDWLISEFRTENNIDLSSDKYAFQRIREAAERAKRDQSFTAEVEINLPFIAAGPFGSKHFRKTLTRAFLEQLTGDLVERTVPLMEKVLADSGIAVSQVDDVILVGGQSRMPLVRRRIASFFGRAPNTQVNPDESVALGAAIQSAILEGEALEDLILLLDVTSLSLGIETENDGMEILIPKNSTIPCRKAKTFTTVEDNQRRVRIHVRQGEYFKGSENVSLAVFDLVGLIPAKAGVPQIIVTFEIDANGMVKVSAKDAASGREQMISVRPSSGLSKQQVDGIIERNQTREQRGTRA